ncbi:MAG: hypothetical protein ACPW61_13425 [Methyloligella sp. ZOD6]
MAAICSPIGHISGEKQVKRAHWVAIFRTRPCFQLSGKLDEQEILSSLDCPIPRLRQAFQASIAWEQRPASEISAWIDRFVGPHAVLPARGSYSDAEKR